MIDLKNLKLPPLKSGAHDSPEEGLCAMEMVAFLERLPHSDSPECTCPVIAAYVRTINDCFNDIERQALLPILHRLVGTVSRNHEIERAKYLANFANAIIMPLVTQIVEYIKNDFPHTPIIKHANAAARAARNSEKYAMTATKNVDDCFNKQKWYNKSEYIYECDYHNYITSRCSHTGSCAGSCINFAIVCAENTRHHEIRKELFNESLKALEGVIEIGPKPRGFVNPAIQELCALADKMAQ